jgi:hypothetical protein
LIFRAALPHITNPYRLLFLFPAEQSDKQGRKEDEETLGADLLSCDIFILSPVIQLFFFESLLIFFIRKCDMGTFPNIN